MRDDLKENMRLMSGVELADYCKKIEALLRSRATDAKNRCKTADKEHDSELGKIYLETAKEFYAFTCVVKLVGDLSKKIQSLESLLDALTSSGEVLLSDDDPSDPSQRN